MGSQLWTGHSRFEQVGLPGPLALDAIEVREIAVRYAWAAYIPRGPVASRIALLMAEAHQHRQGRRSRIVETKSAVLERLLAVVRAGRSGALVLRGEAGIGKTALLESAITSSSNVRVLHAAGVEAEMELTFAAPHRLCGQMDDRVHRLADRSAMRPQPRSGREPGLFRIGSF
jgi:hypothetical protein